MQTKTFDNLAKELDSEISTFDIQQAFNDLKTIKSQTKYLSDLLKI